MHDASKKLDLDTARRLDRVDNDLVARRAHMSVMRRAEDSELTPQAPAAAIHCMHACRLPASLPSDPSQRPGLITRMK